ncbi:MAG: hypothetical protein IPF53_11830 [Blastocatellia bacterium]|nr:hypothetical protein [Blastocatellia bacterium]
MTKSDLSSRFGLRKLTSTALVGAMFAALVITSAIAPAFGQKRLEVALPEGTILEPGTQPVVSLDGQYGFIAPAKGDSVAVFAVRTGEVVASIPGLGPASGIALHDDGVRRLLVVTLPGDPLERETAKVRVFDVTDALDIKPVSTFDLPEGTVPVRQGRAEIARSGRTGLIALELPVPALLSFDLETGQQLGAITLDGPTDRISVVDAKDESRIALVSAESNKVSIVSLNDIGVLLPVSAFELPPDAPVSAANNVVFDASGRTGYVASVRGRVLMSFSLETGELIDKLETDGSSGPISIYHDADRDVVAVVNLSRPGGREPILEPDPAHPFGIPGAILAVANPEGRLQQQSRFYPETGDEIGPSNNAGFSADGRSIYVPARTGSLYVVDVATGSARGMERFDGRVQSIAPAPLAEAIAVVSAGGDQGRLDIVPMEQMAPPAAVPESASTAGEDRERNRSASKEHDGDKLATPTIDRLSPGSIQLGRRRDLPVTIVGSGFGVGATVVADGDVYSAEVSRNTKRVNFTLMSSKLTTVRSIPIQVRNPDGTLSNVVELLVVPPFQPALLKVSPSKIDSGSGGVDLNVRGDHFRDGAIVKAAYTDPSGTVQIVDLRTYRISFTQIIARLPHKLTVRARAISISVLDRDGTTISQVLPVTVAGPSITSITPDRIVAGDLKSDESLAVEVVGENFHRDAVVYVKRPVRGDSEPALYRQLPSSSVKWRKSTKLVVRLAANDLTLSGALAIRVINPVPGERRRLGDAADSVFTVAGPNVASSTPVSVIAGAGPFVLKLEGTDFRRGAIVKFTRTDGAGEVTKRVTVEDAEFKDRKRINIQIDSPELLRLVARPGTLLVRVINPGSQRGDAAPALEIGVLAPTVTAFDLLPRVEDPTEYALRLTGTSFRDGATVQLLNATGEPVGQPHDARFKDSTEIVVILSRSRLNELRTFKVVVINPGARTTEAECCRMPSTLR